MKITTAGESHGKGLFAILEGIPAGLEVDPGKIDFELARRQSGYGRGARQKIERDRVELLAGIRDRLTLGSPIALAVWNRDYENWKEAMAPEGCDRSARRLTCVRPGHADLTGMSKFATDDARNVLERASARETAARVAAGAVCKILLEKLGVTVSSEALEIGGAAAEESRSRIDEARGDGDTLGGVIGLKISGLKRGFGSCMTYAEKLDARLVSAMMSVQAVKGAEVGLGFALAGMRGSEAHDELYTDGKRIFRKTNRAGGIEGGMSNGEEIVLRAAMKPIPTLAKGLRTVDTDGMVPALSAPERSDTCAVEACAAVLEAAVASELCAAVLERLGGDTMEEVKERYGRLPS